MGCKGGALLDLRLITVAEKHDAADNGNECRCVERFGLAFLGGFTTEKDRDAIGFERANFEGDGAGSACDE